MIETVLVKTKPNCATRGILQAGPMRLPAALGRSGIATGKMEGDGKTPMAGMRLLYGFWRTDRGAKPQTRLPFFAVKPGQLWCDAGTHAAYNRPVRSPFSASHEMLMREDHLYDICIVMDWNVTMRKRNGGSAIFLHIAREGYLPTEGCIAISKGDMRKLLRYVGPETTVLTR